MCAVLFKYLVQWKSFGEGETPTLLEGPADHGGAGGGWSTGQPERIGERDAAHLHADVHHVYGWVEERQLGRAADRLAEDGL